MKKNKPGRKYDYSQGESKLESDRSALNFYLEAYGRKFRIKRKPD
jgi:hypothetical protein